MTTKDSEHMSAEEEKSLMAELEYEDACYAGAAEYDAAHATPICPEDIPGCRCQAPSDEELEEASQMDTLRKAALNHKGMP